jgi:hypothetical protein
MAVRGLQFRFVPFFQRVDGTADLLIIGGQCVRRAHQRRAAGSKSLRAQNARAPVNRQGIPLIEVYRGTVFRVSFQNVAFAKQQIRVNPAHIGCTRIRGARAKRQSGKEKRRNANEACNRN